MELAVVKLCCTGKFGSIGGVNSLCVGIQPVTKDTLEQARRLRKRRRNGSGFDVNADLTCTMIMHRQTPASPASAVLAAACANAAVQPTASCLAVPCCTSASNACVASRCASSRAAAASRATSSRAEASFR